MNVRQADQSDIPALVDMGEKFHAMSHEVAFYDPEGAEEFLTALIQSPDGCVYISDTGFISGVMVTYPHLDKSWRTANECFFWAAGNGGDLWNAFEQWAISMNAEQIITSHPHDGREAQLSRLYKIRGYTPHEYYYRKVLSPCA